METVRLNLDKTFYDKDSVINNLHDSLSELTLHHKLSEITGLESSFHHIIFYFSAQDKHINIQASGKNKDIFCKEVNTLLNNGLRINDIRFDSINDQLILSIK